MSVRASAQLITQNSTHVTINYQILQQFAQSLKTQSHQSWDIQPYHYQGQNIIDYIFALDSINFCFWPQQNFQYQNLAQNLKQLLQQDPNSLSPQSLSTISEQTLTKIIGSADQMTSERLRLLRQTGQNTLKYLNGNYSTLLQKANNSVQEAVRLITMYFPGFRDSAIFKGKQVFLNKRAQILVGDLWGAGAWVFNDIEKLTMFPDYRIPQLFNTEGVLQYTEELQAAVNSFQIIPAGSEQEIEIRGACVKCCEVLAEWLGKKPVEIDWMLWQIGEKRKDELFPHHRTLGIFY